MSDAVTERGRDGQEQGQAAATTGASSGSSGRDEGHPEMAARGSTPDADVHQLLEQLARMRELLSGKEAELAEVRSDLTFVRGEAEIARREAETARSETEAANRDLETLRDQLEEADSHLAEVQREHQTASMEFELQRLRDVDELRREFDRERKLMRETREQEVRETREWRKEIVAERNQLRDRVERLTERLAHGQTPDGEVGRRTLSVPATTSVAPSQRCDEESVSTNPAGMSASADLSLPLTSRSNGMEPPPSATDRAPDLSSSMVPGHSHHHGEPGDFLTNSGEPDTLPPRRGQAVPQDDADPTGADSGSKLKW